MLCLVFSMIEKKRQREKEKEKERERKEGNVKGGKQGRKERDRDTYTETERERSRKSNVSGVLTPAVILRGKHYELIGAKMLLTNILVYVLISR